MYTKGLFLSILVHKSVWICVCEHFSFAEIIIMLIIIMLIIS